MTRLEAQLAFECGMQVKSLYGPSEGEVGLIRSFAKCGDALVVWERPTMPHSSFLPVEYLTTNEEVFSHDD